MPLPARRGATCLAEVVMHDAMPRRCSGSIPFAFNAPVRAEEEKAVYADGNKPLDRTRASEGRGWMRSCCG